MDTASFICGEIHIVGLVKLVDHQIAFRISVLIIYQSTKKLLGFAGNLYGDVSMYGRKINVIV